jgi:Bor protein
MKGIEPLLALSLLVLSGCYTTTLTRGASTAPAQFEYDEKWHHGFVAGIAEVSGPYNLARICPRGWAEIKTETSFLNGLVEAVTSGIYAPQTITVRCAATHDVVAPPFAPPPSPPLPEPPPPPAVVASPESAG